MNKLLDAALDYAAQGWAVFPVNSNKQPYEDTRGVLDATTNQDKIKKWWDKWPRANIAVDVGASNMMVLDFDPGHDVKELKKNIGDIPNTPLAATTPRGGRHLFYQLGKNEVVPASASKLSPHVDVRSFHSYVLVAPSRTKDGEYTWDKNPLEYDIKPAYRTNLMVEKACEAKDRSDDYDTWIIDADLPENAASCIKWLKEEAKPAIEGHGGDHITYATAAMCKSYGLSPELAFDLLWDYWNPKCEPSWEADELETKIANAYAYNTSPPGNMTEAYKVAKAQLLFSPVSRDTSGGGLELKAGRFRMVDRAGMEDIKPPTWLIKDAFPEGGFGMLIGPSQTFKTFIALDMGLSVASGASAFYGSADDWLGVWPFVSKPGPVLFAAGEGRSGIKHRVKAWEDVHLEGERVENLYLIDPVPSPNAEDVTPFIEMALSRHDEYSLVILDTVGRSMQGLNENSQQDASTFTRMVETLQYELNCAVLAIHHTGHDNAGRARGSSVFGADADTIFVTERKNRTDHIISLHNEKQKDAERWDNPKLIHLINKNNSLVAVEPTESQKTEATKSKAAAGRKTKKEQDLSLDLVRKVAYQLLKQYPGKEFSGRAFAEGIAADERMPVGTEAVRKNYLPNLLIDKAHPLHNCFDVGKSVWVYRK